MKPKRVGPAFAGPATAGPRTAGPAAAGGATAGPRIQDDRRCFACGPENPHGLQMTFEYGDGTARCVVTPKQHLSGWSAVLHGGIVATLLDEAMAHAAMSLGLRAVTARMEVRFRQATPVDGPLIVEGKVRSRRGRVIELTSELRGQTGTVFAHARGRFVTEP